MPDYLFLSKQSVMSAHRTDRFLSPNGYVIWFGTANYEAWDLSDGSSEDEGGLKDEPGCVTPATRPPNIKRLSVQQFIFFRYL